MKKGLLFFFVGSLISNPKNIKDVSLENAKSILVNRYNIFDLSKLNLDNNINNAMHDFFKKHPGPWPLVAVYKFKNKDGIEKTITYVGAHHNDKQTIKVLKHLIKYNNFDLGIGEWPSLGNTLNLQRWFILNKNNSYGPNAKTTILQKIIGQKNELDEAYFLEKTLKSKGIPLINGEQTIQEYFSDLTATGLTKQDIIACAKWAAQSGYGAGNSGSSTTIQSIRKTTAKVLGAFGIKYNPNNTTISSRTLRHAGKDFKNISIKKSISYTPEQMEHVFIISMIARDCCILTKLLTSIENHNNIIIVYGSSHWFTQQKVLEQYLEKPKHLWNGIEYFDAHKS